MRNYKLFSFVFILLLILIGSFSVKSTSAETISAPIASTPNGCTIRNALRVGSAGTEVFCLQQFLGISPDGKFGPKTKSAIINWQASKGLTADGIFGSNSISTFRKSEFTSNNLWWFDSTHPTCSYKSFFGNYMYQGLQTFTSQADCQLHLPTTDLTSTPVSICTTNFNPLTGFRCGCSSFNGYSSTTGLACGK